MTLIFSHINPVTGLFASSDIVLSKPTTPSSSAIALPFSEKGQRVDSGGYSIQGLGQKTVIFGRTMIMWAGWQIVALAFIKHVIAISQNGNLQIDILEAVHSCELSSNDIKEVSFIYHFNLSEQHIVRHSFNCEKVNVEGGSELVVAGSGSWSFFENVVKTGSHKLPIHEEILANLIGKIAIHSVIESGSTDTLEHLYGGWFEIAFKTADSFQKVPYAIKFWVRKEGWLGSGGPLFFGWYLGSNLIISGVRLYEEHGEVIQSQKHFPVSDLLGRRINEGPPEDGIRPFFICHHVIDEDSGYTLAYVEGNPHSENMIVEASARGLRVAWTHALRERLYNLKPNEDGVILQSADDAYL